MYSKGKILVVSLVALVVLGIGIVREGFGRNTALASNSNIVSNTVEADTVSEVNEENMAQTEPKRGKGGFRSTLKSLQESGVLTETDVKNIETYHKEKRKSEMKERISEDINDMINNKVITAEKGAKLKEALEKELEKIGQEK